jgi:hypothetical protein
MGFSRYDAGTYRSYASSTAHYTPSSYTTKHLKPEFDPKLIGVRQSKKSDINPHPTPVVVALDQSGSMGEVVEAMRKGLGTLFEQVIDRKPVSDPHVMAMAVGDMEMHEEAPLQVTQFEADPVTIGKQVEELYLEGKGGGNAHESYLGPLYFVAMRTDCDAFTDTPPRKGFLFTVGDEEPQTILTKELIQKYIGDEAPNDLTAEDLVKMIEPNWHYYHLMVMQGSHARRYPDKVKSAWRGLVGERAIPLSDHTKMSEVIISLMEVVAGRDKDAIIKSWGSGTDLVVADAIAGLPAMPGTGEVTGPVAL